MKSLTRKITIGCFILALISVIWGIKLGYDARDGRCIPLQPRGEVISGRVRIAGGGIFSSGTTVYLLFYPGKYEVSGKECQYRILVTEAEYSRQIYGNKK